MRASRCACDSCCGTRTCTPCNSGIERGVAPARGPTRHEILGYLCGRFCQGRWKTSFTTCTWHHPPCELAGGGSPAGARRRRSWAVIGAPGTRTREPSVPRRSWANADGRVPSPGA
jgi:hypothetical protein